MRFNFPLINLSPSEQMSIKFTHLGLTPTIDRIFASIILLDNSNQEIARLKAIFDTGAIISLMPGPIPIEYHKLHSESLEIWGVIKKKPCIISCQLIQIPL